MENDQAKIIMYLNLDHDPSSLMTEAEKAMDWDTLLFLSSTLHSGAFSIIIAGKYQQYIFLSAI